ncbi:hypothetical protein JCM16814_22650 [Desulfobaculum senezii]
MARSRTLLVDGREYPPQGGTGISRVLDGLVRALVASGCADEVRLAVRPACAAHIAKDCRGLVRRELPASRLAAEVALSRLARRSAVTLSPYPKVPVWAGPARVVNIVHDVLNITHERYRTSWRARYARVRLAHGLRRAALTWYDSAWSREQTQALAGWTGRDARVRHLGIAPEFSPTPQEDDAAHRGALGLAPGYVLVLGNGRPHKNIGVALSLSETLGRPLVIAGCPDRWRLWWQARHPAAQAVWLPLVPEAALPALYRGAFCLLHPALIEGYGFPPLEAMACGVPAIVSDIPVLRETAGGAAVFAPPDDRDAWRAALARLEDGEERRRVCENALVAVAARVGPRAWDAHVADIRELFDSI